MALVLQHPFSLFSLATLFSLLLNPCFCLNLKEFNISKIQNNTGWSMAGATWYGSSTGAGSDGGACGYGDTLKEAPFNSMISAGGPSLFKGGKGCGACYQVKCSRNSACSGVPVTVVIADECPGCTGEAFHFDLSGTAFGALAKSGQADQLRNAGVLLVEFRRVQCNYRGVATAFRVDPGSNPYYFASAIEYVDGDGSLSSVELKRGFNSNNWLPMQQSWGAVWKLNSGSPLLGPLSFRLTSESGKIFVADNVIPVAWLAGQTYLSFVNFKV